MSEPDVYFADDAPETPAPATPPKAKEDLSAIVARCREEETPALANAISDSIVAACQHEDLLSNAMRAWVDRYPDLINIVIQCSVMIAYSHGARCGLRIALEEIERAKTSQNNNLEKIA